METVGERSFSGGGDGRNILFRFAQAHLNAPANHQETDTFHDLCDRIFAQKSEFAKITVLFRFSDWRMAGHLRIGCVKNNISPDHRLA